MIYLLKSKQTNCQVVWSTFSIEQRKIFCIERTICQRTHHRRERVDQEAVVEVINLLPVINTNTDSYVVYRICVIIKWVNCFLCVKKVVHGAVVAALLVDKNVQKQELLAQSPSALAVTTPVVAVSQANLLNNKVQNIPWMSHNS